MHIYAQIYEFAASAGAFEGYIYQRKAGFFTQLDWVQEQCQSKLGFRPYPGTLNIEIDEEGLSVIEALNKEGAIALIPPNPQFCAARAFPLSIASLC